MFIRILGFDVLQRKGSSLVFWLAQPVDNLHQRQQSKREIKLEVEPTFLPTLAMSKAKELFSIPVEEFDLKA